MDEVADRGDEEREVPTLDDGVEGQGRSLGSDELRIMLRPMPNDQDIEAKLFRRKRQTDDEKTEEAEKNMIGAVLAPPLLMIGLSLFIFPMLSLVVDEKEKGLKQSLKMVGLPDSVFWCSWFGCYAAITLFNTLIASLGVNLLIFDNVRQILLVFCIMWLFCLTMVLFAFILTVIFNQVKTAMIAGGMAMTLVTLLYLVQEADLVEVDDAGHWGLSLFSPFAFAMSMRNVSILS